MELEELHILCDDMGGCAILFISPQLIVDLYNVSQFMSQVILRWKVSIITVQPPLTRRSACMCQTHSAALLLTPPWEAEAGLLTLILHIQKLLCDL
jgi:hypothetical protein